MAKIKFRSNIAELSEEKCSDACIDSGATYHFLHNRSVFLSYAQMDEEPAKRAAVITKIVSKGLVQISVNNGIIAES